MGVFEMEAFAKGTFGIAHTLADLSNKVLSTGHVHMAYRCRCHAWFPMLAWLFSPHTSDMKPCND